MSNGTTSLQISRNKLLSSRLSPASLRDEWRNEEWFDSLDDARRKLSLWRYDYYQVRPHSSQGNKAPDETRRTLEKIEGSSYHTLVQTDDNEY
jgi:putative transposase